ncbi:hypothetical protein EOM39_03400 [Candidatus Gracilibacteria bacterium]|nr:hypothetical protein [Candidatus Gracilibacteria bacterium]
MGYKYKHGKWYDRNGLEIDESEIKSTTDFSSVGINCIVKNPFEEKNKDIVGQTLEHNEKLKKEKELKGQEDLKEGIINFAKSKINI